MNLYFFEDDKAKGETKSRSKRRLEDSLSVTQERKSKQGLHALNTAEKISIANLSVQQVRMNVEVKQTKLLSYAAQENSIKSQIESARQLALIVCPTYNENNPHWKRLLDLMKQHSDLSSKMASLTDDSDFGMK